MARRVFFSFHFERDCWRAGQVRNCWITKPDREDAGYWDATKWEEVKKRGDDAVKKWIDGSLEGTSVTAVLIGYETYAREWVEYEIKQSYARGNGMLGIYVHNIKDSRGYKDTMGANPFDNFWLSNSNPRKYLSEIYSVYDWVNDSGYHNLGDWIEQAAKKVGK